MLTVLWFFVLVHIPEVSKAFSFRMASFHSYIGKSTVSCLIISERFRQFYFFTKRSTLLLEKSRKINFLHLFFIEQHAKLLPFLLMLVDQVKS